MDPHSDPVPSNGNGAKWCKKFGSKPDPEFQPKVVNNSAEVSLKLIELITLSAHRNERPDRADLSKKNLLARQSMLSVGILQCCYILPIHIAFVELNI